MSTASEASPLLRSPGALVAVLCITSVLGMLGFSSFAALLPEFQRDWGLSNTDAGWISGIFYAGYVVAVPLLVGSTDRVDPRRIYLLSFLISAAAALGYALLADGFWSALSFRALAGVGLAGGYMPGLKLLTDRVGGPRQSRYVAFYTAGFSLGTAFSFAFTGEAAAWLGWRGAFAAAALAGESADIAQASWLSMVIVLVSAAASIYGAELATRSDRRRVIGRIMMLSVVTAALTGLSAGWPIYLVAALCLLYHMVIMGDSAALTGGAVAISAPGQRGATLAVHSILGFTGAFLGPLAVGAVLDLAGGETSRLAWGLAFLTMGAGSAAALVAIRRL